MRIPGRLADRRTGVIWGLVAYEALMSLVVSPAIMIA